MSNLPGSSSGSGPLARRERRGAATVRLGTEGSAGTDMASMMDPATKSLADALRWSYRFLLFAIVVLFVLFAGSGFTTVGASERGLKLRFGQVVDRNLEPGPHFGWPAPIGEIIRVPVGPQVVDLRKVFFPNLAESEDKQLAEKGSTILSGGGSDSLDPNVDGQLLTADGAIVHARWTVNFVHDELNPELNAKNIGNETDEQRIVRAVAMQAIVRATASVTLDEFMRNIPDENRAEGTFRTVESLATQTAQAVLDKLESGIVIQSLEMTQKFPPRRVMPSYFRVQAAESESASQIEDAVSLRREALQAAAGDAAELILTQINQYELDLAKKDTPAAEATLARIDLLLMGEAVTLPDGRTLNPRTSGMVTSLLDGARQERTSMVATAKAEADLYDAKLAAFKANPKVLLNGDWADAYLTFATREGTQIMLLPPGAVRTVLSINRDPVLSREQDIARFGREFDEAQRERLRSMERARFEQRMQGGVKASE